MWAAHLTAILNTVVCEGILVFLVACRRSRTQFLDTRVVTCKAGWRTGWVKEEVEATISLYQRFVCGF